jgi:hypothetical protein
MEHLANRLFFMYNSSAIILRAHRPSLVTISRTFAIVSAFERLKEACCLDDPEDRLNHSNIIKKKTVYGGESIVTISLFYQVSAAFLPVLSIFFLDEVCEYRGVFIEPLHGSDIVLLARA